MLSFSPFHPFANMLHLYILNTHVDFPSIFMLVSSTRQIFISVHQFFYKRKTILWYAAFWSDGLDFRFEAVVVAAKATAAAANRFWPVCPVCHVIVIFVCSLAFFLRKWNSSTNWPIYYGSLGSSIIFHVSSFPCLLLFLLLTVLVFLSLFFRYMCIRLFWSIYISKHWVLIEILYSVWQVCQRFNVSINSYISNKLIEYVCIYSLMKSNQFSIDLRFVLFRFYFTFARVSHKNQIIYPNKKIYEKNSYFNIGQYLFPHMCCFFCYCTKCARVYIQMMQSRLLFF